MRFGRPDGQSSFVRKLPIGITTCEFMQELPLGASDVASNYVQSLDGRDSLSSNVAGRTRRCCNVLQYFPATPQFLSLAGEMIINHPFEGALVFWDFAGVEDTHQVIQSFFGCIIRTLVCLSLFCLE